jgi:RNA polymerase subunit RPABC4/transcription elongation factor Spt4
MDIYYLPTACTVCGRILEPAKEIMGVNHEELTTSYWSLLLIADVLADEEVHMSELG